ncbi:MAG TPA: class I SAM-dependent rRNA methyltransferase [Verrucomicrobiales bacterium]|nr:class I SAM-dependent rRNA methyltransferase [Verrucomicrobiales bacterium]
MKFQKRDGAPPVRRKQPPPDDDTIAAVAPDATWREPWVQLKYFTYSPAVYPRMLAGVSQSIRPGALVTVYDRNGAIFGAGFYNAKARVPLRVIHHGANPLDESHFDHALDRAVSLRRDLLKLDDTTEAWRVISSDGDYLSGLTVDRYADVLCAEVHSLGVWQRLDGWMQRLHAALGTKRQIVRVDPEIARIEGIRVPPEDDSQLRSVRVRENGIRYEVNFAEGHKTGFFCDQRDNRRLLATFVRDQRVLDLCCYTGGFALSAKISGGAGDVTAVDLDEKAIEQAKRNANLNQCRGIDWVHTDAFTYARTMIRNGEQWDTVVLDPPKLVHSRDEEGDEGRKKYEDLNGLAVQLVKPGGLLVTCSCSGLIGEDEFERLAIKGAHRNHRRLQFLHRTGAAPDHPVMSNCLESRYLKVLWARVF